MPPRRWKLNDCTSNAFYFDFNQHVQKLLDKETKCLFQKWFPIFIIALTLAGVRHLRVDTLACGVKKGSVLPTCGFPRNRCMRMFPIQLILTDSYITSTFRILSPYIYIYIYIIGFIIDIYRSACGPPPRVRTTFLRQLVYIGGMHGALIMAFVRSPKGIEWVHQHVQEGLEG